MKTQYVKLINQVITKLAVMQIHVEKEQEEAIYHNEKNLLSTQSRRISGKPDRLVLSCDYSHWDKEKEKNRHENEDVMYRDTL